MTNRYAVSVTHCIVNGDPRSNRLPVTKPLTVITMPIVAAVTEDFTPNRAIPIAPVISKSDNDIDSM